MAEINYWERLFVEHYIVLQKKDFYLTKLKGRKHRREILERLNHSLDYRQEAATTLSPQCRTSEAILDLLQHYRVADTCHIMAYGNSFDRREIRIEMAIDEMLGSVLGFIMICPPIPIAVYKAGDVGDLLLLMPAKAS